MLFSKNAALVTHSPVTKRETIPGGFFHVTLVRSKSNKVFFTLNCKVFIAHRMGFAPVLTYTLRNLNIPAEATLSLLS